MKQSPFLLALFSVGLFTGNLFSQVISPGRSCNWSLAGYPGNIPVYAIQKNILDFGAVANGSGPNDAALQLAIASLNGDSGTIFFPPGDYLFNAPVSLGAGVVLKGAGSSLVTLRFNLAGTGHLVSVKGMGTADSTDLVLPARKDDGFIMVNNTGLFSAGDYVKIYEAGAVVLNDDWAWGSVAQLCRVDSVVDNRIFLDAPLRRSYPLSRLPRVQKLRMVTGTGIECMKIKRMDATVSQSANIYFSYAADCWVSGVESDSCNFAHLQLANSCHIEISNNYFHGAFAYGAGGQGYGISCEYSSGECLVENNVFKHLRHAMLVQSGANGNVFGYNYSLEPFKTDSLPYDLSGDIVLHGNYPYLNLFEGNIVQNIVVDASHGINGPFNTFFRNRAEGYGFFISPGAGDSSNIAGNEISGTGFQKGNFYVFGQGLLNQYNNKNDTILLPGSSAFDDRSCYRNSTPYYWNVASAWPSIGVANPIRSGTIPAAARYASANDISYCSPPQPVVYRFMGNGNWSEAGNWEGSLTPPPAPAPGSEIIIDPEANGACVLDDNYVLTPATILTIKRGKRFEIGANLLLVK